MVRMIDPGFSMDFQWMFNGFVESYDEFATFIMLHSFAHDPHLRPAHPCARGPEVPFKDSLLRVYHSP